MSEAANDVVRLYGSSLSNKERAAAIEDRRVPVALYGLGKMGLPLAAVYADRVGDVTGVDVNDSVVESVNRGECHVGGEPRLPEMIADAVDEDRLRATTDASEASGDAAIHIAIVPTPVTDAKEPDLSILDAVVDAIGENLSAGDAVFIECTVPPKTCSDRVAPALAEKSGLDRNEFGVAFCPERTSSGRAIKDITGAYPKIVGGVDEESSRVAETVYRHITDNEVIPVSDATTAESVKLFEGLYRDVNIALANELGTLTEDLGIDVIEAIDAANTQPFCEIHRPGPGVGGHCIPWYPYFVMNRVERDTPLLRTARQVNDSMPGFTAETIERELDARGKDIDGSRVLVLGITYRAGVKETRATPSGPLIRELNRLGAETFASDPLLDDDTIAEFGATPVGLSELSAVDADAVVVVTPHEEFDDVDWESFDGSLIVDGRNSIERRTDDTYVLGSGYRRNRRT